MKPEFAVMLLRPGAQWSMPTGNTDAALITWHDDTTPITQEEFDAQMALPDPEPTPLTPTEKLASAGLTVDELKSLLGLG
jgi:hypothetical protein